MTVVVVHGQAQSVRAKRCWPTCEPCHKANVRRNAINIYRREGGYTRKQVSATESQRQIEAMMTRYNKRIKWIAEETGIARDHLSRIRHGQVKMVYEPTARKIFIAYRKAMHYGKDSVRAMDGFHPANTSMVAVRGLMAQGYNAAFVSQKTGLSYYQLLRWGQGQQQSVRVDLERRLLDYVREIGCSIGPDQRVARHAAKRGWKTTMNYDELV